MKKNAKHAKAKPRTFAEVRELADRLSRGMHCIDQRGATYPLNRYAEQMAGVAKALEIIGTAPNATLSEEGLRAFEQYLEKAIRELKGWVRSLKSAKPVHDGDDEDDYIPF